MIQILQHFDLESKSALIEVKSPKVHISITLLDRTQPVRLEAEDRQLMEAIAISMLRLGARPGRLRQRDAQYAIWAIAQYLKVSAEAPGESLHFGDLDLIPATVRHPAALISVEAPS